MLTLNQLMEEIKMKKQSNTAKSVKGVLNQVLKSEANSTSCTIIYQPKAPKNLESFKKN